MALMRATATIGFYTLLSRVLGFLRDVTIASSLGAGWVSDAFFVAFKIPNFLRRLFAEGAFNAAFVPLYSGTLTGEGKEKAQAFAGEAISFLVAVLLALSGLSIVCMPWLMFVLAPGFADDPQKFDLTVLLTRITFPYIIFMSIVCLLGGVLNSAGKFAAVAATPILMNVCLIVIPSLISPWMPTLAHGLAVAVFISGIAQAGWLVFFCRRLGVMPSFRLPRLTAQVKKLLKLMGPAAMGAGVAQINLFIDLIIASQIAGGVSYLYYADRINELPLAVIGIAVGTVLLPSLSRYVREGNIEASHRMQNRGIEMALLLALPAAAALMAMAPLIVSVLYERGEFSGEDAAKTSAALVAFAAGLPAFVLAKVLSPAFYANQDTNTPFRIAVVCVLTNFMLNITLIGPLEHVGMALATTLAGWLNVGLMLKILSDRGLFRWERPLLLRLPRMVVASGVMAAALWFAQGYAPEMEHFLFKAAWLGALVAGGVAVYGASVLGMKAARREDFARLTARFKR